MSADAPTPRVGPDPHDADLALDALRGPGRGPAHDLATHAVAHATNGRPERLARPTKADGGSSATTSDLSVDEAICVEHAGYEPLGLVFGSAVYRASLNWWGAVGNTNAELTWLSEAVHRSRAIAMTSMRNQAAVLGAAGVVGVRLEMHGRGRDTEFLAVGTAIGPRRSGSTSTSRSTARTAADAVFTSDLSGKDFYLLTRAGYRVLGLVMGVCIYHVARQSAQAWMQTQMQNTELTLITEALYDSRELAMGRMQQEALGLGASGVVGMSVEERAHVWGSHAIEFLAIGTAVTLAGDTHQPVEPTLAVPLSDIGVAVDPRALRGG